MILPGHEPPAGGVVGVVGAGGVGVGLAYAVVSGDGGQVLRLTAASLVSLPAVLVLIGATTALYGLAPRWALAAWGPLALVVTVELFGELLRLPEWTRAVSPFHHLPAVPAEGLAVAPLVVLGVLGAGLVAAGLWGLQRRDVHAS